MWGGIGSFYGDGEIVGWVSINLFCLLSVGEMFFSLGFRGVVGFVGGGFFCGVVTVGVFGLGF